VSTNCVKCGVADRTRADLLCDACGTEKDITAKSMAAIQHVLRRIRDDESIGYFLGAGTESFHLLTVAASALWDTPLDEVETMFRPRNPIDPRKALQEQLDKARGA
jgi:hypothetical protein